MFEITDEFLAEAGFTLLEGGQKEALREQVTLNVQRKIGDRISEQVNEEGAEELSRLLDGDAGRARDILGKMEHNYQESPDFKQVEKLGKDNGASDDEIVQEYAVVAWMKHYNINIADVVQGAMNDAMTELKAIYQSALDAMNQ